MKNAHPIITATTRSPVNPDSSSSNEPAEPIIRLKLDKPLHWEWELTTSADTLPVIQLLDKDGRLLVETSGRTAQRARGSFRDGLKSYEEFLEPTDSNKSSKTITSSSFSSSSASTYPLPLPGNRNIDGFSSKFGTCDFGYRPRKSRSEVSVKEKERKSRKRHSAGPDARVINLDKKFDDENFKRIPKRYSAGDYLRQQIIDDLCTRGTTTARNPDEIAKDRYRKVKAYLRSQSDILPNFVETAERILVEPEAEVLSERDKVKEKERLREDSTCIIGHSNGFKEVKPICNDSMKSTSSINSDVTLENSLHEEIPEEKEDLACRRTEGMKLKSKTTAEDLVRIKAFLQDKIQRKMQEERSRSLMRCNTTTISGGELKKRQSEYREEENPRAYRTRKVRSETSIMRCNSESQDKERLKIRRQQEKQRAKTSKESLVESFSPKVSYRRSRSDAIIPTLEPRGKSENHRQRSQTRRESSSLEKRKLYRKTKSDLLLGHPTETSFESDKDFENPPRRIRSQDNVEESWREYKERKKHERLHRETERDVVEEDFMSKPRWKDLQKDLCSFKNCKICQNSKYCVDPLQTASENKTEAEKKNNILKDEIVNGTISNDSSNERPGTSLQENYLVVEMKSKNENAPAISKIEVTSQEGPDKSIPSSADCGYNSIPKRAFKDYRELYARSNVKKSDTFKIVDGSEDPEDGSDRSNSKENSDELESNFGCSTSENTLANKSNEDIARDYFKRVYELLKKRQEEAKRVTERHELPGYDDSSSSNYADEIRNRRQRRRRKERSPQGSKDASLTKRSSFQYENDPTDVTGEEVVTVAPGNGGQEWNRSSGNRRRGCKAQPQPQSTTSGKRGPSSTSTSVILRKVNVKDNSDYFDWPNKENTPGNAVNVLEQTNDRDIEAGDTIMGSNLSCHNGKGLTGRRTQSSGNLCDPKGKLNSMGKILVPCSSAQRERYKFCGSLPNHLDDKDALDDDSRENNNTMADTITGNLGGTLPHKKRSLGVHFSDSGPTGTLDLVKHRSQDSLDENDPWRYQQSDLDLVRCRHGNFDSVRRNRSVDTVSGDSVRRYGRGMSLEERCQRNTDLDLVGTLPKRKQDIRSSSKASESNTSSTSSQPGLVDTADDIDNDLLMKIVHKPDCELLKHRQQFARTIDLQLSKLTSGEPQDQGYASERSPEDEHPPSLPGQPFPNITPESTFRVTLQKSSRGLGLSVSGGGTAGPVRVKRLFPQQPAALSNKLQPGDILLAANGIPLTGLTNYEALEVLRTTPSTVELVVCRLPGDSNVTPPGAPPPPPARREPPPPLRILNPLPPLHIEPCGEFDIEMTKVGGSLGFTLRKADSSALGHYVRALVREPALSDGRIRPGDKIVAVDGAPLSPMSHEEAVQLLRQCGPTVRLRLYRDLAQTPVSALSPTEPDHPLRPPRTCLRQEAVDMLCDLAVRKLSPGTSSGSSCKQSPGTSSNSPRRIRRLATKTSNTDTEQESVGVQTTSTGSQAETSDSDQCSIRTQITNSQPNTPGTDIIDPPPLYDVCDSSDSAKTLARPSFLDLTAPQGKPRFQFRSVDSESDSRNDTTTCEIGKKRTKEISYSVREAKGLSSDEQDNDLPSEPASMPPVLSSSTSSSTTAFSYKNPAYQSANPACGANIDTAPKSKAAHSSDQDIPGKILGADDPGGSKGLLKWKGVMFAPDDDVDKTENEERVGKDTTDSAVPTADLEQGTEVFMVELTRGWNSRLGFSLQPEGNRTVISVVHPDSVAAKDGRLKQGDVLLMVNDESVEHMTTADIIDLLRKIRGSIGITVMRRTKRENTT